MAAAAHECHAQAGLRRYHGLALAAPATLQVEMSLSMTPSSIASVPARADSLGCAADQLHESRELTAGGLSFYRKQAPGGAISRVETAASDRGFLVGVSLQTGHRRRIFSGPRGTMHEFDERAIYVRDFADDYRADIYGSFDFLLFEVPRGFLLRMNDEHGGRAMRSLNCGAGLHDPVLGHLAQAVVPILSRPGEASALFLEQLGVTIGTRLLENYGQLPPESAGRRAAMSRRQLALAQDMLLNGGGEGDVSVADVAQACAMSRSHFIRAFRETTGLTPYQWLVQQRMARARELLKENRLALAEVALACGFADQSHFTRVFTRLSGVPPGRWRRDARV